MSEELLYWLAGDLRWSDFPPKADMIATIAALIVVAGAIGVVATAVAELSGLDIAVNCAGMAGVGWAEAESYPIASRLP